MNVVTHAARRVRRSRPTAAVALGAATLVALVPHPAGAAPAVTDVRIEGRTQTLFEGPVLTDGGELRSSSDTRRRTCNGTNNGHGSEPRPTATRAAVEALRIVPLDFDAVWFTAFDDYYVTRFGPDHEDADNGRYWGILVNDAFTPVGGCQFSVATGDRVLWAYDAFRLIGFLKLAAAGDTAAAPTTTLTAVRGTPFALRVTHAFGNEHEPFTPRAAAKIAPVSTAADGAQRIELGDPAMRTTATDGTADVTFTTLGWHRLKAEDALGAIRSNRVDVCVVAAAGDPCPDPVPADVAVRVPPPLPPEDFGPPTPDDPGAPPSVPTPPPGPSVGAPLIEVPRFTNQGTKQGRVGVRWRVIAPGVGVRRWTFSSRLAGSTGRWTVRARGTRGTSTVLRLPAGRTWQVRATFVDALGRSVSETVGDVLVPIDDRARAVQRRGSWKRQTVSGAWRGSVSTGRAGATLRVRLTAGRPVLAVRRVTRKTTVDVRIGTRTARYRLPVNPRGKGHEVVLPRRARAGNVQVRVVSGEVDVDGLGVRP